MTRARKQTVDYFPHQCHHGETIFILEQRYGNDGYAFWFKLLELLGKTEGHSLDLNKITTLEFLASSTRIIPDKCFEILSLLARLEAIDQELWESKIIWSENFVKGISDAYRNRVAETPKRPAILRQKSGICGVSDAINPQSKVKESKVKKSKDIASPESPDGDNGDAAPAYSCPSFTISQEYFESLLTQYPGLTGVILNRELSKMADWLSDNPKRNKRTARGHLKNPKLFIRNWIERMEIEAVGGKAWYE